MATLKLVFTRNFYHCLNPPFPTAYPLAKVDSSLSPMKLPVTNFQISLTYGTVWLILSERQYILYTVTIRKRLSVDGPPASCPPCQYPCPIDLLNLSFHIYRFMDNWQTHGQTGQILYPRPLAREGTKYSYFICYDRTQATVIEDLS